METRDAMKILKEHDLRTTGCREDILTVLLGESFALSHADIEARLPEGFDRITLYRTLKTFVDKGLIHKVLDDEGNTKYALCKDSCSAAGHHHGHVHFKCTQCGLTNCLEQVQIPAFALPEGYNPVDVNLLVQGVCRLCSKNALALEAV